MILPYKLATIRLLINQHGFQFALLHTPAKPRRLLALFSCCHLCVVSQAIG